MDYAENSIPDGLSAESHARKDLNDIIKKIEENPDIPNPHAHVYKCEECNKTFEKFQALGGHKASHKKTRSQMFLCKVCGEKFEIRQALGEHMRKHEVGELKNAGGDDVGHVLQQPEVEALQELKVDVLQEQKAK